MADSILRRIERLTHDRDYAEKIDAEWREAILEAIDAGEQVTAIARAAGVSRTRVYQINRER